MKPLSLTSAFLLCTAVSAWPSYFQPAELLEVGRHLLEKRQASSFNLSFSADQGQITTKTTTTSASAGSRTTQGSATTTITGSQSGSASAGSTASKTDSKATTSITQSVFDPRLPPGGISMQTPNPLSGTTFYKIQDYVTFGWNYTSCSILPTAIDILAVASDTNGQRTFTLATNQTVSGSSQAFTWDTGNYQSTATPKLPVASYTLLVHDADVDATATPRAGYLGTFNQFYFAMYTPQPTADFNGVSCITCSGAMSSMEKQTFSMVFGMMAVTVLSFTWFAGAAGIF